MFVGVRYTKTTPICWSDLRSVESVGLETVASISLLIGYSLFTTQCSAFDDKMSIDVTIWSSLVVRSCGLESFK